MTAAETVARELHGLAADMRGHAEPDVLVTLDADGLHQLAGALERAASVLRGELLPAQLLLPAPARNVVRVDFGARQVLA